MTEILRIGPTGPTGPVGPVNYRKSPFVITEEALYDLLEEALGYVNFCIGGQVPEVVNG